MSEQTLVTFTCGECGRGGFTVVDRNPPIPMEVVAIYDKDNEGEDCAACPHCGTVFPKFHLYRSHAPECAVWMSQQPYGTPDCTCEFDPQQPEGEAQFGPYVDTNKQKPPPARSKVVYCFEVGGSSVRAYYDRELRDEELVRASQCWPSQVAKRRQRTITAVYEGYVPVERATAMLDDARRADAAALEWIAEHDLIRRTPKMRWRDGVLTDGQGRTA